MSDTVIKVEGLYKKFTKSLKRSMMYGTADAFKSMIGLPIVNQELRKNEFWALQDINFELKRGETLGLIGQNGCGKSTLLRLINGIFPPDRGKITINGRIGALIAVGAGFHPHMTGRENVFLNGTILGMTKTELKQRFDSIVDFAEIGEFIDAPVATYSSGMTVRLGFAIAIHCEPDILLIDEILAVGDVGFQLKCFNKIGEFRNDGVATILVAHDLHTISTFTNKCILIEKGLLIFSGNTSESISLYKKKFNALKSEGEIEKIITGSDDFVVQSVKFEPELINKSIEITTFQDIKCIIEYKSTLFIENLEIDIAFYLPLPGPHYFQSNNQTYNKKIDIFPGNGTLSILIPRINLNNIGFHLNIAICKNNRAEWLFWWKKIPIYVNGNSKSSGWTFYELDYSIEQNDE